LRGHTLALVLGLLLIFEPKSAVCLNHL
jgi:hypothetical protein